MIRFALACEKEHGFEGWFPSGAGADTQLARGLVSCPVCGSTRIAKALMAPSVAGTRTQDTSSRPAFAEAPVAAPMAPPMAPPLAPAMPAAPMAPMIPEPIQAILESPLGKEARAAMKEMKAKLLENSENVGDSFAREARAIHEGESDRRIIHGKATPEEARALREDGIAFSALPVLPDEMN
jgi:hypothetical protein